MVAHRTRVIGTTPIKTVLLVLALYAAIMLIFRYIVVTLDLPRPLTTLTIWLVLLAPYVFSRRVAYSMLTVHLALSLVMVYRSAGLLFNAFFTTIVTAAMVAIMCEVAFRVRSKHLRLTEELKKERERAERADHAKGSFLANMSHEIRTPISGIMGVTEILRSENPTPRQQELLAMITDSSDVLLNIVNNILDYSKIEAGRFELSPEPFSPDRLFSKVVRNFELMAEQKGLLFTSSIPDDLPASLEGDRYRFRQILTNLISNAVKYTDRGTVSLTVEHRRKGSFTEFEIVVADTGMGIPDSVKAKLFTPFEQGDSSYRKTVQGTGLGLSITKSIIEMMHGEIIVQSTEGEGSSFTVKLELPITEKLEHTGENAPESLTPGASGMLLLAEDNKVNQMYLTHFLEKAGFRIKLAENGVEAVDYAKKQRFDAILMDIQMPMLSGIEATAEIRSFEEERALPRVPIFALTASATEHDRSTILSSGIDHFCPKPVDMRALLHKLQKIV